MYDAVSDRIDPGRAFVLGCTARRQPAEHPADCGLVVRDGLALPSRGPPFPLEGEGRLVPDALDDTAREAPGIPRGRPGVMGKDLELERRAPAVEGQDDHGWTGQTVTASRTLASTPASAREGPVLIERPSCPFERQPWPSSLVGGHVD